MAERFRDDGLYENQLIGAFVYVLGAVAGCRLQGAELDETGDFARLIDLLGGWASLIQQTPFDPIWGDLIARTDSRFVLLEFKRTRALIRTERGKGRRGQLIEALRADAQRHAQAWSAHWVGFPSRPRGGARSVRELGFLNYPRAWDDPPNQNLHTLPRFLKGLAPDGNLGLDAKAFAGYLAWVARVQGDSDRGMVLLACGSTTTQARYVSSREAAARFIQGLLANASPPGPDHSVSDKPKTPRPG